MNCCVSNIMKNLTLQICLFFCQKVYILIWIMGLVNVVFCQWNEDAINKKIQFVEFCNSAYLEVLAYPDNTMNTITVSFKLLDSKYKDCFEYYDIFLERRQERIDDDCRVWNKEKKEVNFSCTFENITCGLYEVIIQPCYDKWECSFTITTYSKLMNMSSSDCIIGSPLSLHRNSEPKPDLNIEIVIGLAVASVILIIFSGLIYYYCWSARERNQEESELEEMSQEQKTISNNINVYILHYYDKNNVIKSKVQILKDELKKSSYFKNVRDIEDELADILFDVNEWIKNLLKAKDKDGNVIKLILIDSENFEDEECEIENLIYSKIIKKLSNDLLRCYNDYHCLFVVRVNGITTYSEILRDIVKRGRYTIPRDINVLCINLSSA